jgi:hypothetical protein
MSKSYYLTEDLFSSLRGLQDWQIHDIPPARWDNLPRVHRKDDLFAVYASGCCVTPKVLNKNLAIVGIDFLAHEPNPNTDKGEDSVNIYHFTISKLKVPVGDSQYRMDGPYFREALLEHWPCSQDALDFYSSVGLPFDLPTSECSDTTESV